MKPEPLEEMVDSWAKSGKVQIEPELPLVPESKEMIK